MEKIWPSEWLVRSRPEQAFHKNCIAIATETAKHPQGKFATESFSRLTQRLYWKSITSPQGDRTFSHWTAYHREMPSLSQWGNASLTESTLLHYRDKSLRQTPHSTAFQPPTAQNPSLFRQNIQACCLPTTCNWPSFLYPRKLLKTNSILQLLNLHLQTDTQGASPGEPMALHGRQRLLSREPKWYSKRKTETLYMEWYHLCWTFGELLLKFYWTYFNCILHEL